MSRLLKIGWLIGGSLILFLSYLSINHTAQNQSPEIVDLQPFAENLSLEAQEIFSQLLPVRFHSKSDSLAQDISSDKWYFLSYKGNELVYWNSNKLSIDSSVLERKTFPIRYSYGDDIYLIFKKNASFLAYRIINGEIVSPRLVKFNNSLQNKLIDNDYVQDTTDILTLKVRSRDTYRGIFIVLSLLGSFLFLILFLFHGKAEENLMHLATIFIIGINLLMFFTLEIPFHDYFFLSNQNFDTLSQEHLLTILFIHLISIILIGFSLIHSLKRIDTHFIDFITITLLLFCLDFFINLSENIITHVHISLDLNRLVDLSISSYVLLFYICLSFILFWVTCYLSKTKFHLKRIDHWISFIVGSILFIAFQSWNANRITGELIGISVLLGLCFIINTYIHSPKKIVYLYSFLTAAVISVTIYNAQQIRKSIYLAQYANDLITPKYKRTIQRLSNIENQLAQEFLTPLNYDDFDLRKEVIEGRIKQLYFSNYLGKFDLKLFSFNAEGNNVNQNTLFTIQYLDSIYNTCTKRTTSAYFYKLDELSYGNGLIAKYENCDLNGHYGTTFILLKPRIIQSDFLYPESFANQKREEMISIEEYSFGIYASNTLISQLGEYPYKLNAIPKNSNYILFGGFKHHRYSYQNYDVILSTHTNPFRDISTIFTFILIIIIVIGILGSSLLITFSDINKQFLHIFLPDLSKHLSSRIQVAITSILIIGLLLSVYTIVHFEKSNYNATLEEQLLNKIKIISSRLQNRTNLYEKLSNKEKRILILNEESNIHQVDINLFDQNGKLLGSSKPYIVNNQILGSQMNPVAFNYLSNEKASQLLVQEELEGSDYLSAYIPLFNDKNNVIGYLNTPLFSKNELLNKQISNLIINIINVYFVLLMVGGVIAYLISKEISKPLESIRRTISKTVLRGSNEIIQYNRDDEIGQLVKQYNTMAMELQESALQIANSEREGAWKEMARQVAHEIKNPLTPMKLSVQHLQRSIDKKPHHKLEELIQKTTELLLQQINSLSIMAEQFSSFAQMPKDQFDVCNLSEMSHEVIELFKHTKHIDIVSDIQENIFLWADREQIKRVLINIIKNATQAIPENQSGIIQLTIKATKRVQIEIRDNGKGIAPENHPKIFTPNFSTKNSGMGLGLALSKKIIENTQGQIRFESIPDQGTTFFIDLPLHNQ